MERIDKKNKSKVTESLSSNDTMQQQIEVKKNLLLKEQYSRQTLQGLHHHMISEIQATQKEINLMDTENKKFNKYIEKERINETVIKERVNSLYSKAKRIENVSALM